MFIIISIHPIRSYLRGIVFGAPQWENELSTKVKMFITSALGDFIKSS